MLPLYGAREGNLLRVVGVIFFDRRTARPLNHVPDGEGFARYFVATVNIIGTGTCTLNPVQSPWSSISIPSETRGYWRIKCMCVVHPTCDDEFCALVVGFASRR